MSDEFHFVAGGIENLDPMIAGVGHPKLILFVECQALWPQELTELFAVTAPLEQKLAVSRELLNAIILSVLGHVEVALGVLDDIGDKAEFARCRTKGAANR